MRAPASPPRWAWFRDRIAGAPPLHLAWLAPVDAPSGPAAPVSPRSAGPGADGAGARAGRRRRRDPAVVGAAAWMRALFDESGRTTSGPRRYAKRTARVPDLERLVGEFGDALRSGPRWSQPAHRRSRPRGARLPGRVAGPCRFGLRLRSSPTRCPRTGAGPVGLTPSASASRSCPAARASRVSRWRAWSGGPAPLPRATLVAFVAGDRLHLAVSYARSPPVAGAGGAPGRAHRRAHRRRRLRRDSLHAARPRARPLRAAPVARPSPR